MRTIRRTSLFRRDYRREKRGQRRESLDAVLNLTITSLGNDETLPQRLRDHALSGNWADYRDCHVMPDLVLIYRKIGDDVLELARLGSHSELRL